ncbi:MAG: hypothetical protein CMH41_07555 [Micrococcales bacterium]|nr:hypothetical protein [Micrococcales bacterium]
MLPTSSQLCRWRGVADSNGPVCPFSGDASGSGEKHWHQVMGSKAWAQPGRPEPRFHRCGRFSCSNLGPSVCHTRTVSGGPQHIALVCWGFPPFRGSGAFRPLAIANALAASGAEVSVVTANREVFLTHYGADVSLEALVDPRVEILRIPFFPDRSWPLVNDWSAAEAAAGRAGNTNNDPAHLIFPELVYSDWLPRVSRELVALNARKPISLVLGTGAPYIDLEAASQLYLEQGIPLVLDDRDCSIFDVYSGKQSSLQAKREVFFRDWIENCSEMWFVNPPIADRVREIFPQSADKVHVVENGWDRSAVDPARVATQPSERIKAAYVGLVATKFPLEDVIEAWHRVAESDDAVEPLRFIGALGFEVNSPRWQKAAGIIAAAPHSEWRGHVPRADLPEEYADLDVLVFVKEGGQFVTGGKPYEYAATGLPIVALVDEESDALRVLGNYPRLYQASPDDPVAAADALRAAIEDRRSDDGAKLYVAQEFGAQLSRAAKLDEAVGRVLEIAKS